MGGEGGGGYFEFSDVYLMFGQSGFLMIGFLMVKGTQCIYLLEFKVLFKILFELSRDVVL